MVSLNIWSWSSVGRTENCGKLGAGEWAIVVVQCVARNYVEYVADLKAVSEEVN